MHFSQAQLLFAFYRLFQFLPYYVRCGPATLNQQYSKCKKIKQLKGYIYTLVKRANFDGQQHTHVHVSTKVSRANRFCG